MATVRAAPATNGRRAIFITGAACGIGLATARRFAAGGGFVGLADIDAEAVRAFAHGKPKLHHLVGGAARQVGLFNRLVGELVRSPLRKQSEAW